MEQAAATSEGLGAYNGISEPFLHSEKNRQDLDK